MGSVYMFLEWALLGKYSVSCIQVFDLQSNVETLWSLIKYLSVCPSSHVLSVWPLKKLSEIPTANVFILGDILYFAHGLTVEDSL